VLVAVILPGKEVAVYKVIACPPSSSGALNVKVAVVVPVFVAVPIVGASGTEEAVVILLLGEDGPEVPSPLVAVTVKT